MKPKISIIFPAYNNYAQTKKCLASITKLDYPKTKIEVIVVDNASTDGTPTKIRKFQEQLKIKLIENKSNLGFAKAINIGARQAAGDYLFITNNDIIFEKNSLNKLLETHQKTKNIGLTGPKILFQDTKKLAIAGFKVNPWLGYFQYDKSQPDQKKEIDYVPGCGMFIAKTIFEKMGKFDPYIFIYFEDLDFCLRLKRAGYKILYEPRAIIYHGYAKTMFQQRPEKAILQGYISRFYCLFKNASFLQIICSLLAVSFLALSLEIKNINDPLVRGKIFFSMVKAFIHNLKDMGHILKKR